MGRQTAGATGGRAMASLTTRSVKARRRTTWHDGWWSWRWRTTTVTFSSRLKRSMPAVIADWVIRPRWLVAWRVKSGSVMAGEWFKEGEYHCDWLIVILFTGWFIWCRDCLIDWLIDFIHWLMPVTLRLIEWLKWLVYSINVNWLIDWLKCSIDCLIECLLWLFFLISIVFLCHFAATLFITWFEPSTLTCTCTRKDHWATPVWSATTAATKTPWYWDLFPPSRTHWWCCCAGAHAPTRPI